MASDDTRAQTRTATLASDFERLRAVSRAMPPPSYDERRDLLRRLMSLVREHSGEIEQAISADFGHRPARETRLAEIMPLEAAIKHALRHLGAWMQPRRVATSLVFWPGSNRLLAQPLGVAGIVSPWNYPLNLTLVPAVGALAAGNRVLLKPSELTPGFAALLQRLVASRFADTEMAVATGGVEVSRAFCALPFDHLLFTGSTAVGRQVAQAASRNLTPVTLELGGKSPVIIDATADIGRAATRVAHAKILNAGQTCIAPDYVICPADRLAEFERAYLDAVAGMLGDDPANPDYTSIISERHLARLDELIADAVAKGGRIRHSVADPEAWKRRRKLAPCLALETSGEMRLRREEIFGPILPVVAAASDEEAIDIVNAGDRPLALYWFGRSRSRLARVLRETVSGGVTVNDCILHQAQEHQPFGGVGPSGMGAYHGEWGFRTFSKEKPVYRRPRLSGVDYMAPPYGRRFDRMLAAIRWLC